MIAIRPALSSFLDAIRGFEKAADPKVNPKLARFQQPVPKVTRLRQQFDAFENAADQKQGLKNDLRQASQNTRSATPPPRQGMTDATNLHRDGFESATRKPVELAPKPPPSYRAPIAVFRFR